jgi:hypothetical protein
METKYGSFGIQILIHNLINLISTLGFLFEQQRLGDALDRRESLMEKFNKEQHYHASAQDQICTLKRE